LAALYNKRIDELDAIGIENKTSSAPRTSSIVINVPGLNRPRSPRAGFRSENCSYVPVLYANVAGRLFTFYENDGYSIRLRKWRRLQWTWFGEIFFDIRIDEPTREVNEFIGYKYIYIYTRMRAVCGDEILKGNA